MGMHLISRSGSGGRSDAWRCVLLLLTASSALTLGCGDDGGSSDRDGGFDATLTDVGPPPDVPYVPDAGGEPDLEACSQLHAVANQATQKLILNYWVEGLAYFAETYPTQAGPSDYFGFLTASNALFDAYERTEERNFPGWVLGVMRAQIARGGFEGRYNDDVSLAIITLLRATDLLDEFDDTDYLDTALELYDQIREEGWDETCCGDAPGGIWWNDRAGSAEPLQKTTAANAMAVIAGASLYGHTGNGQQLAFAKQVYDYWFSHMVDDRTFAVEHSIEAGGDIDHARTTQDQGLMIGAALALHEATGDAAYLEHAHGYADFMLDNLTKQTAVGEVLFDGDSCIGRCPAYKGFAYRYLLALHSVAPRGRYREILESSVDGIRTLAYTQDFFAVDWAGPVTTQSTLVTDVAAITALNLAVQLQQDCFPPPGNASYPVEEAVVEGEIGIGYDRSLAGEFEGWGHTAGWDTAGSVSFRVYSASDGLADIAIRYAAYSTTTRSIILNGNVVEATHVFAGANSWTSYRTSLIPVSIPAGWNTIDIVWNPGETFLNLDGMRLLPSPACDSDNPSITPLPLPYEPGDGEVLCLNQDEETSDLTLCWEEPSGVTGAEVFMDGSRACTESSGGCCVVEGVAAGSHDWVVSIATDACESALSAPQKFTLRPRPSEPRLGEPEHAAVVRPSELTFTWAAAPNTDHYDVWVDNTLVCASVRGTECHPDGISAGNHRWRVVASNGCGYAPSPARIVTVVP